MQRPCYWLQSDPDFNGQWRRLWTEPPWPKRRRAAPSQSTAPFVIIKSKQDDNSQPQAKTEARRARAEADALFKVGSP